MNQFISFLSAQLWGWPMILLLLGTHIYLTLRLRFPQRHIFRAIKMSVTSDQNSQGDVSQFGALATALAATIGTGNIIGVGTAVCLGGPGAVLWCWLTGVFGISTKYAEALLAVKYRVKDRNGNMHGGPMYSLLRGLGWRYMAIIFSIFTVIASMGIGNMVQCNAITMLCYENFQIPEWQSSAVVALLAAIVILGGVKSIARICTAFVPIMALLYVLGCIYILIVNAQYLIPSLQLILQSAFSPRSAVSGMVGGGIMMAARYGIARGLFSNESGMGSAPIVAAAARTRNIHRQALISSTGTFWDTVVVCAMTGLVVVTSVLAHHDIDYSAGAALTHAAFSTIPYIGTPLLLFGITTFAFSTILGWSYYGEKGIEFLAGTRSRFLYRIIYVLITFLGGIMPLTFVWDFSDLANGLMCIPNLLCLLALSGVIVRETRKANLL